MVEILEETALYFPGALFQRMGFFSWHDSKSLLMVCLDSRGSVLTVFSSLNGEALAGDMAHLQSVCHTDIRTCIQSPAPTKKVYILIYYYYSEGRIGRFLELSVQTV